MDATGSQDHELPRAVAIAWGIDAHPQRGPKRELSTERIVDAAIEIADAEGLAAVSMNRVAASLGFTPMSLYRYLTSKDDLVLLMQEVASEIPVPELDVTRSWREGVVQLVLTLAEAYREHPWLLDIRISGAPFTPNSLALVDWFLRELRELPLRDGEKIAILLLLTSFTRACGMLERDLAARDAPDAIAPAAVADLMADLVTPERFPWFEPVLRSGGYLQEGGSEGDEDFRFGLSRILDGIERFVELAGNSAPAIGPPEAEGADGEADQPEAVEAYPRDPRVRAANRARRDAERAVREAERDLREAQRRLREARRKEQDEVKRARGA